MMGTDMPQLGGTLLLLLILMFLVYRALQALNSQTMKNKGRETDKGNVFHMPERKRHDPPRFVTLIQVEEDQNPFTDPQAIDSHNTLKDRGELDFIGNYSVNEMPEYFLGAYTHPLRSLVGILYRDPENNIWVTLITEYQDGRVITSSSAENVPPNPRPKGMPLFNFPGLSTERLLRRHKLETHSSEKKPPIPGDNFTEFFSANYARLRGALDEQGRSKPKKRGSVISLPLASKKKGEDYYEPFVPSRNEQKKWLDMIYAKVAVPEEKRTQYQRGLVWVIQSAGIKSISETVSEYANVNMDEVEKGRWVIHSESGAEDIIEPGNLKGPALFDKINSCLPKSKKFSRIPVDIKGVSFYSRIEV